MCHSSVKIKCVNSHRMILIDLLLNVRGPSYLGITRSISWLLKPWLLPSPSHQYAWYWLCRIIEFLSYFRKDIYYLCDVSVEEWLKMLIYNFVLSDKFRKWLNVCISASQEAFQPAEEGFHLQGKDNCACHCGCETMHLHFIMGFLWWFRRR